MCWDCDVLVGYILGRNSNGRSHVGFDIGRDERQGDDGNIKRCRDKEIWYNLAALASQLHCWKDVFSSYLNDCRRDGNKVPRWDVITKYEKTVATSLSSF